MKMILAGAGVVVAAVVGFVAYRRFTAAEDPTTSPDVNMAVALAIKAASGRLGLSIREGGAAYAAGDAVIAAGGTSAQAGCAAANAAMQQKWRGLPGSPPRIACA